MLLQLCCPKTISALFAFTILGACAQPSIQSKPADDAATDPTANRYTFALFEKEGDKKPTLYASAPNNSGVISFCFGAKQADCVGASAEFADGTRVALKGEGEAYQTPASFDPSVKPYVTVRIVSKSDEPISKTVRIKANDSSDNVAEKPDEDTTCSDLLSNPQKKVLYTNPSKVKLTAVERQMICYTLNIRVLKVGRSAMVVDPTLMRNSRAWAGANARDRAPNRHSGQNVAENAFHTVPNAKVAVAGWEASSEHYANIVGPYSKIGVGVAYENGGSGIPHWIEQFIW